MDEQVYQEILDQLTDGVYFVDRERVITYWNSGAERLTGYTADEVLNHSCSEGILRHVSENGAQLCLHGCPLLGVMRDGKSREAHVYLHHKEGHRVPVTVRGRAIRNPAGEIVGSIELFHKRSATRFSEDAPSDRDEDAYVDELTGIGNRRYGMLNLKPMVAAVDAGVTSLGVLFLDVDHFKSVNDTRGHRMGDAVLRMVGQNIANGLRSTDFPVRWGGEEFVALLPGADANTLEQSAERLRMLVEHSWIQEADEQVRVTVSIGATLAQPGEGAETVLDRADRLMYVSKESGRNLVTTDDGVRPRGAEPPLQGTEVPWTMAGVDADH
ncbi:MAG: GGDEF domain-containing protein [Candidatus Nanopelagicales bacterium]